MNRTKTIRFRIEKDVIDAIEILANDQMRKTSDYVRVIVMTKVKEYMRNESNRS